MIVKVQLPVMSSEPRDCALVSNKDRSTFCFVPITDDLLGAMDRSLKRFFEAHFEPDGNGGSVFHIDADANWQEW